MIPRWATLNERDRATYRAIVAFLTKRLNQAETVRWALQLRPDESVKRFALLEQIDSMEGQKVAEPWRSAWRFIEESWGSHSIETRNSTRAYTLQHRLSTGDRSGALVNAIVEIVAPRLHISPFSETHLHYAKFPKKPRKVEDIFSMTLTSGELIDPKVLKLAEVADQSFLLSLARTLESAIAAGLDIAQRSGWEHGRQYWRLGQLSRVYYVSPANRLGNQQEPDAFHRGIAPSVKLLHNVVSRLAEISISNVLEIHRRWKSTNSSIYLRLWASLSRDAKIVSANEVSAWLLSLDDRTFWDVSNFPEVAELRAKRFGEFKPQDQMAVYSRLQKLPPRNLMPKKADANRVENARNHAGVLELRRIEAEGAKLPEQCKAWISEKLNDFPDLSNTFSTDQGFPQSPKVQWVTPNPDNRFDLLVGEERLKMLEIALSSPRTGWGDDSAGRAEDWINLPGHASQIVADFESLPDAGAAFPRVWTRFGWVHRSTVNTTPTEQAVECARVLKLLNILSEITIHESIDGIAHWLFSWGEKIVGLPIGFDVWLKVWPIAVEVTNAKKSADIDEKTDSVLSPARNHTNTELDTLNTPTGKLVGIFLAWCPTIAPGDQPFKDENLQRKMRDAIELALGASGSIVKYRLIEHMPYFLLADREWTIEHLVRPLKSDQSSTLWSAVSRQIFSPEVMNIIGDEMANRVADIRLDRETRQSLVFKVVIDCLYAFKDNRTPAVSHPQIQQMIRSLNDEVRTDGAEAIQRFVHDLSIARIDAATPEQLFKSAAAPFLKKVWPQERSLTTPAISKALASLPATAKDAFVEVVEVIERFLMPFDCWSMLDYGLFEDDNDQTKLSIIDNNAKAEAFLRLLDLTIGTSEGAVIPYDLADALDQIRRITPSLATNRAFRRLATAARR